MFFQAYLKQRTFTIRQLLTRNTQRYLCLLVLLILALPEAHACGGLSAEHKLFFTSLPDPLPDADVVAKVILLGAMAIGMAIQNLAALYFVKRYLGFFPIG